MSKAIDIGQLEKSRIELQSQLDEAKTSQDRNRLGQFATPTALASDILAYARGLLPSRGQVRFFDPAIGTGSFYSALLREFPRGRIKEAKGFEIDPHYGKPALELWKKTNLQIDIADFTEQHFEPRFNLLICNPPYVRHHHMTTEQKARLQQLSMESSGARFSGLAGLYCHFVGLSHQWLAPDAISGWLIPSEFMDVNYGQALKKYLLDRVTLLRIHRFDPNDVQFADALVSSAVVWFRNSPPPRGHVVQFTYGGNLQEPARERDIPVTASALEKKWTRFLAAGVRAVSDVPTISDFFTIKRGLATGNNKYFILEEEDIAERDLPMECFKPILPSPRYLKVDEIRADDDGYPVIGKRLFLLDPDMAEEEIEKSYPSLWRYLEEGQAQGLHERYLCRHRSRWYAQEKRPPAPIVCTYLGRGDTKNGRPFRFILNESRATVANVYLTMYPTPLMERALNANPKLIRPIWKALNRISAERLLGEGRVYGGGLHKLEPKELANVPVPEIAEISPEPLFRQREMNLQTVTD